MKINTDFVIDLIVIISLLCIFDVEADFAKSSIVIGKTTSQLVELRGYIAIDHTVTSQGYLLNLVEVLNPEVPGGFNESKSDILFIHGLSSNANCFMLNAAEARPKNYADLNVNSMDEKQLLKMLRSDPSAKSLPFLSSNFQHRVWLLNRRGTIGSRGHIDPDKQASKDSSHKFFQAGGKHRIERRSNSIDMDRSDVQKDGHLSLETFGKILSNAAKIDLTDSHPNPRYWNFSQDEQAAHDIPAVIDYILEKSNKKNLTIVGHSNGGSLTLMLLSTKPEYADKSKFSS